MDRTNILSYLANVLQDETWLEMDIPHQKIIFNFAEMITSNEIIQNVIVEAGTNETEFIGTDLISNGYIELKMEISLFP